MSEGKLEGLCKPEQGIVYTTKIELTPVNTMKKKTRQLSLGTIIVTLYFGILITIALLAYKILYVPEPDLSLCPFCNQQVLESL
jgi:hypothetical protein